MSDLTFVNINGDAVDTTKRVRINKARATSQQEYHKGFRVVGIPPGAFEAALSDRAAAIRDAKLYGHKKTPPELTHEAFRNAFRGVPVRSKPYEVLEAARLCKELAEKAGWDRVEVVEIKRVKSA